MRRLVIAAGILILVGCERKPLPAPVVPPAPPAGAESPAAPAGEAEGPVTPTGEAEVKASPGGEVVELTEANFEEKTSKGVVLVDFWAPWCPPCRMQGPMVEEVARKFAGRALVCKLNTDEAGAVARRFNISGIPTLIIFRDGKEASRMVGLREEEDLSAALEKALGG